MLKSPILSLFIREHIREQYEVRQVMAKTECTVNGECVECGCKTPQLYLSNESCEGNCYPEMMTKKEWKKIKSYDN